MQTNYDRQAKLAESAPLPELQALSKGANPRLVQPFVALGALNARMAQMQSDKMLQGAAAPGSMPTLKDKLEQSLQQMKAAALRQQAAQRAAMQAPGMFQVPAGTPQPQDQPEAPEAQMYAGGVARLPVRDDMFGYAGGGIIAFSNRGSVPKAEEDDDKLSREDAEAIRRRMKQRTDMTPESMDVTDLDFTTVPGMEKGDSFRKAMQATKGEQPEEGPESEVMRAVKTPFRAIGEGIRKLYSGQEGAGAPLGIAGGNAQQNLASEIANLPTTQRSASEAPTAGRQAALDSGIAAAARSNFAQTDPRRVGNAQNIAPPAAPSAAPPAAPPPARPATPATPAQDMESKLMSELMTALGPQPARPSIAKQLEERDKYVESAPTTPEALAMLKHYDEMAKRFAANDEAEKAQQAINQRNNLWALLSNVKGSTLGAAASRANAALQPLLETQETRRQTYQKLRDEQEMLLGKARYETTAAERARKEGRYADAQKHDMEAQKLAEQARGHTITGISSLVNALGGREERRLGREQQYQMHRERMAEIGQRRQEMQMESTRIKDAAERTQRENAYGRQSAKIREEIAKQQKTLDLPDLPEKMKRTAEATLERLQKQDNDMYERIVVRGDKDYRPQPSGTTANSALTSKADKIAGVK